MRAVDILNLVLFFPSVLQRCGPVAACSPGFTGGSSFLRREEQIREANTAQEEQRI